jgi:hypothetical protein
MIRFTCPGCKKRYKVAAHFEGRLMKCGQCQTKFKPDLDHVEQTAKEVDWSAVGTPLANTVVTSLGNVVETPPVNTVMVANRQKMEVPALEEIVGRLCPFCEESVSDTAKKCKHCGETLDVALRAAQEAKELARSHRNGSNQQQVVIHQSNHHVRTFPHVIHLVFTIFTGGLWLPVWLIHYCIWSCS